MAISNNFICSFYEEHGHIILNLWSSSGGKVIDVCIFRNSLLNIRTKFTIFSLLYPYLHDLKPVAARILLDPGISAAMERAN